MGALPWVAHTQADYARLLLSRNERGDRERARELSAEAVATYRQLGMGYANLGALLMAVGLPYDSDGGRALAGALAGNWAPAKPIWPAGWPRSRCSRCMTHTPHRTLRPSTASANTTMPQSTPLFGTRPPIRSRSSSV